MAEYSRGRVDIIHASGWYEAGEEPAGDQWGMAIHQDGEAMARHCEETLGRHRQVRVGLELALHAPGSISVLSQRVWLGSPVYDRASEYDTARALAAWVIGMVSATRARDLAQRIGSPMTVALKEPDNAA